MNLSQITSLEWWGAVAQDFVWKISPPDRRESTSSTWPIDPERLADVSVIWPSEYEWQPSRIWVESLRRGLAKHVQVERSWIAQPYPGIVLIQIRNRGAIQDVALDYSDYPLVNQACAARCSLYFKMQFPCSGEVPARVLPGGFVPFRSDIYRLLPHIRRLADRRKYSYDVYGRFGPEFAKDIRCKAYSLLSNQNYFRWAGSLHTKSYPLSLQEIARSRICIDLPGSGDFCFRLIDYMAVGACIIARRHKTTLHVPLVDGEHIVYAKEDLSDLVDLCRFYLENDEAREALRRNSRAYFDRYLHRDQLAGYYLYECLKVS
jgi:hypothetical protein